MSAVPALLTSLAAQTPAAELERLLAQRSLIDRFAYPLSRQVPPRCCSSTQQHFAWVALRVCGLVERVTTGHILWECVL